MGWFNFKSNEESRLGNDFSDEPSEHTPRCCVTGCFSLPMGGCLLVSRDAKLRLFNDVGFSWYFRMRAASEEDANIYLCSHHAVMLEFSQKEVIKEKEVPANVLASDHILWLMDKIDIDQFGFSSAWDDLGELDGNFAFGFISYAISLGDEIIFNGSRSVGVDKIYKKRQEKIAEKRQKALNKIADIELQKKSRKKGRKK